VGSKIYLLVLSRKWENGMIVSYRSFTHSLLRLCKSPKSTGSSLFFVYSLVEGSLEVKLPTIWTDEKQSREEAERRDRLEEGRVEEKE
jgi:hypothetical protein